MIETKVKASTVGTLLVSLALAILNAVQDNPGVLGSLPAWAQFLIITLVPALVTFFSGYAAKHTSKSAGTATETSYDA